MRNLSLDDRIERTIKFGEKCIRASKHREQRLPKSASKELEPEYRRGIEDMLFTLRTKELHDGE